IGEWGASPGQFEEMLSYIENEPRIKFDIYFNVKAQTGNYKMNTNMKKRYKKYLKKLAQDNFNFKKPGAKKNPDIKKGICFIPQIPDPSLTIRYIPEDKFLSEAEFEQQVCSAELKSFAPNCLAPFPDGFSPVTNMPPRTIGKENFNRAEKKCLDPDIGDIYDYGTHQYRLRASKIQAQIDKNNLKYETLANILKTICYKNPKDPSSFRDLAPFNPDKITREVFLAEHPEIALIKDIAPNFAAYLKQPKIFWENIIILYGVYIQEAIERNDQPALKEAIAMGKFSLKAQQNQKEYKKANYLKEPFSSSKYRAADLTLSLAEAHSQARDLLIDEYQEGLGYVNKAILEFKALGETSGIDYFSISKGILIAADLHAKIAQQQLLFSSFEEADAEYQVAKYLYDQIANLDISQGKGLEVEPFKATSITYTASTQIEVKASPKEITAALEENIDKKHINFPQAIASVQGIFRFLRGMALIKQAAFSIEYPYTPYNQKGYEDIIQNMVLVKAGMEEIEKGSPFADARYFKSLGNLLISKLLISLADSLSYSTSEMPEAEARTTYRFAVDKLEKEFSDLLPPTESWLKLEKILNQKDYSDEDGIEKQMAALKKFTKASAPPDYVAASNALLKQTFTQSNYRINFMNELIQLSASYLEEANNHLFSPNQYGIDDDLEEKIPVLYAELLLQEVNLALRKSEFIELENKSLSKEAGKMIIDNDKIDVLLDQLESMEPLLPETSFLKIELVLTHASLELSRAVPKPKTSEEQIETRKEMYKIIDLLKSDPPNLSSDNSNRIYRTIVSLEKIRKKILAQPEPNKTLLLNQLETKLSLAYLWLAANIIGTFPEGIQDIYKAIQKGKGQTKKTSEEAMEHISAMVFKAKKILTKLENKTNAIIASSSQPLLYNIHDLRVEIYHQLAILSAIVNDKPPMQFYLFLAKQENLASSSLFNVYFRSWILNRFAIPKAAASRAAQNIILEITPPTPPTKGSN
ncbi:MAG: hypothetical protein ABIA67_01330, partial [Candidatus Margulisiibacteriota bacterium]